MPNVPAPLAKATPGPSPCAAAAAAEPKSGEARKRFARHPQCPGPLQGLLLQGLLRRHLMPGFPLCIGPAGVPLSPLLRSARGFGGVRVCVGLGFKGSMVIQGGFGDQKKTPNLIRTHGHFKLILNPPSLVRVEVLYWEADGTYLSWL